MNKWLGSWLIEIDHGVLKPKGADHVRKAEVGTSLMKTIEKRSDVRATTAQSRTAFKNGAEVIGSMDVCEVSRHKSLGIWGLFGKTQCLTEKEVG